ncbi:hypothetical protein ACFL2R_02845 [Patescibacteria group bacterium]
MRDLLEIKKEVDSIGFEIDVDGITELIAKLNGDIANAFNEISEGGDPSIFDVLGGREFASRDWDKLLEMELGEGLRWIVEVHILLDRLCDKLLTKELDDDTVCFLIDFFNSKEAAKIAIERARSNECLMEIIESIDDDALRFSAAQKLLSLSDDDLWSLSLAIIFGRVPELKDQALERFFSRDPDKVGIRFFIMELCEMNRENEMLEVWNRFLMQSPGIEDLVFISEDIEPLEDKLSKIKL